MKIFNRCKNQNVTFDLKYFVKSWRNKAAQASFLKAIIDLEIKEPGTFKFSDLEKIQIDSTYSVYQKLKQKDKNYTFVQIFTSVHLLESLFDLSDTPYFSTI